MGLEIYYKFILAFAIILLAARIGGELARRYLKQPPVLGELLIGIVISPFALGGLINDPIIMNFAIIRDAYGLHEFSPMEIISHIAIVILLFVAGLETDIRSFTKNILPGSTVALGGVIVPFIIAFLITSVLGYEYGLVGWLFMGAALTATSVGVTVRLFLDMGRLQTKPGTIIVVAAVMDDIISIVILSMVVSIARTGSLGLLKAAIILVSGFGSWFILLMVGMQWNKHISSYLLKPFRRSGTVPVAALLIGFLIAYLVTLVNLHPIVGAYLAGLMFAATAEKEEILDMTRPLMLFLGPFFFTYLGMQVELPLLLTGAALGLTLLIGAILGKFAGCYVPARMIGRLRHRGAMIVGIGMIPRGEVGLIVAGTGLLTGAISRELFGIAVAVSIVTTLLTPTMLKPFLRRKQYVPPAKTG